MLKIILPIASIVFLTACGSSSADKKSETGTDKKEAAMADNSKNPDYEKGLGLIAKSDCLTCHKVDEKITGPSYRDVANKYAGLPDTIVTHLASKVISGGNGVWGDVFMLPHPGISKEDAEAMVKYILLLKN
jgi:cytochrome c